MNNLLFPHGIFIVAIGMTLYKLVTEMVGIINYKDRVSDVFIRLLVNVLSIILLCALWYMVGRNL